MAIQAWINPLKNVVYGGGEPTGDAHARMKVAMAYGRHHLALPAYNRRLGLPERCQAQGRHRCGRRCWTSQQRQPKHSRA